ncbi:MAG TPA: hypothetical protein DCY13_11895 [Verrucomicrobiales bacterium]|nr:hypothetical protein [Verrucomicrobiales bacterium]
MNAAAVAPLGRLGQWTRDYVMEGLQSLAVLGAVLVLACQPRQWRRTVRSVFARQLLFTGVRSARFAAVLATLAGVLVVVQASLWLGRVGLSQMSPPLLVAVLVRELGPLLAGLLVIVNSGSAMATELGLMKLRGEVRVLQAQGLEPLPYLVMPRVLAAGISSLCLSVLFIAVAFASGFVFEALLLDVRMDATIFAAEVLGALRPADALTVFTKGTLPGLFIGVICTTAGLNAGPTVTGVPTACRRALVRSVAVLFVISATVSLLAYL